MNVGARRNEARYRGSGRCWATPPEVFDPLNEEFSFTLDPCASPESAKVSRYFTEEDDGLTKDWGIDRVFMNPPYGREIAAWTRKARLAASMGALVVGLLPCSCDQAWFHDDILSAGAEIRFVKGRIRFLVYKDGKTMWASPFVPNIVVIWRPWMVG